MIPSRRRRVSAVTFAIIVLGLAGCSKPMFPQSEMADVPEGAVLIAPAGGSVTVHSPLGISRRGVYRVPANSILMSKAQFGAIIRSLMGSARPDGREVPRQSPGMNIAKEGNEHRWTSRNE